MRNLTEYCRPSSPDEAVRLKSELGDAAVYLAGGTDLLVHRPERAARAVDIRHIGLGYCGLDGDSYAIGGAALLRDAEIAMKSVAGGMLARAFRETAPWVIRNAATVAGNIANASPAADSVPAMMVLDAELRFVDDVQSGVSIESILLGPHRTSLQNHLIREIRVPVEAAQRTGGFIKLSRSKSDIAQVNVAVAFRRDGDQLRDVRIALGAVAPTAIRARRAEQLLEGQRPTDEVLHAVADAVTEDISPISDWRASAEYRSRMSGVLVRRAIVNALG